MLAEVKRMKKWIYSGYSSTISFEPYNYFCKINLGIISHLDIGDGVREGVWVRFAEFSRVGVKVLEGGVCVSCFVAEGGVSVPGVMDWVGGKVGVAGGIWLAVRVGV
jgi:hypothetical protein